jgi:hypothetical protein
MAHAATLLLRGNHREVAKWKQLLFHRQQARGSNAIVIGKKDMHAGPGDKGTVNKPLPPSGRREESS